MKFDRSVLQINTHRLTDWDCRFNVTVSSRDVRGSKFLDQPDLTEYPKTDPTQPDHEFYDGHNRPNPTQVADLGYYVRI